MEFIKSICLLALICVVVIDALGVNDIIPTTSGNDQGTKQVSVDKKPRFMDFDGLITSAMSGMDIKVNKYVNQASSSSSSSSSSFVKKVTQSHGTFGGPTIVNTEITEYSGNNPVGFRFKRDVLDDFMYNVGNKAEHIKHKLAGAMADGVNIAHSGYNKVKNVLNRN